MGDTDLREKPAHQATMNMIAWEKLAHRSNVIVKATTYTCIHLHSSKLSHGALVLTSTAAKALSTLSSVCNGVACPCKRK